MGEPCFCCRPDCYECNPDLWMAAVNADFETNYERYCREYDEAEAEPLPPGYVERMMARVDEMIREREQTQAARRRVIEGN